jgi:YHS domain-containing protein
MTAMMRQISKQILTIAIATLVLIAAALPGATASVVTRIVTDPLTGVAIDGYDPVSYFTDPEPLRGSPDHVYVWGGVPWYFASEANRDVFMRAPEVYAPQYGGHCSMSLARGYLSDGKPHFYVVEKMQLHLFYSASNREAFLLSPGSAMTAAVGAWPAFAARLSGPDMAAKDEQ